MNINVRLYDNGGTSADRYTAVYTGRYRHNNCGEFFHRAMSENPFHPMGVGMAGSSSQQLDYTGSGWGGVPIGRKCHLGTRIPFEVAPPKVQLCIAQDLAGLYPKNEYYLELLKVYQREDKKGFPKSTWTRVRHYTLRRDPTPNEIKFGHGCDIFEDWTSREFPLPPEFLRQRKRAITINETKYTFHKVVFHA